MVRQQDARPLEHRHSRAEAVHRAALRECERPRPRVLRLQRHRRHQQLHRSGRRLVLCRVGRLRAGQTAGRRDGVHSDVADRFRTAGADGSSGAGSARRADVRPGRARHLRRLHRRPARGRPRHTSAPTINLAVRPDLEGHSAHPRRAPRRRLAPSSAPSRPRPHGSCPVCRSASPPPISSSAAWTRPCSATSLSASPTLQASSSRQSPSRLRRRGRAAIAAEQVAK